MKINVLLNISKKIQLVIKNVNRSDKVTRNCLETRHTQHLHALLNPFAAERPSMD